MAKLDVELSAMSRGLKILGELDYAARNRVAQWLLEKASELPAVAYTDNDHVGKAKVANGNHEHLAIPSAEAHPA